MMAPSTCKGLSKGKSGSVTLTDGLAEAGADRGCSAYLLVEVNHERALLGGWVQHSGAPAGRSRGSTLLYKEV